ncbi:hypothetical protein NLX83_39650 [Allokutzneria sp. A3M-2-11 16]|uniref:hypothetical protein n=1 Tax=Allokutzneria sp. A3M-2-11 16 TaxID=2962043 RepID=UPI0020B73E68|nr:hypothetical protein [Allokutzneria sp. A3M-2-11 16]MCP3805400.1 hypothetical protein [Allokutzneria sp. A3M-2-11 16]
MITRAALEIALDRAHKARALTATGRLVLLALACWARHTTDAGVDVLGPVELPELEEFAKRLGLRQSRVAGEVYRLVSTGWLRTVGLGLVEVVPGGHRQAAR